MRFGLVHRVMTDALAVLGILALVTSGKLDLLITVVVVLALAAALAVPVRWKQQGFLRLAGVVAPLTVLVVQVARLGLGAEPIPVIVEFAALLQIIRLATRRGAAHDHQVILLSLLHLIAGTVLGGGLTYALALFGFLILTPGALVLSHLRREVEGNYRQGARDRTGMPVDVPRILRSRRVIGQGFLAFTCLLSLPVFLFTALLFLVFPRVGFSWLVVPPVEPQRVVGFSDRVDLGGVGTIRSDPALVMRVRPDDIEEEPRPRRNLYLKGAVFDRYDGRSWARSLVSPRGHVLPGGTAIILRRPRPGVDRSYDIHLEPIQPNVVFVPDGAVSVTVQRELGRRDGLQADVQFGPHGQLHYRSYGQSGLSYDAYLPARGRVVPDLEPDAELERYLQLPDALSPRVARLAEQLIGDAQGPAQIAQRLEAQLRSKYEYDLGSPSGGAQDPLEHFLFESKRGHCEFYSTAMAMMLRTQGIPSRNVTGFVGGTYNRFGEFYAVRQGDAHSWVEAYLPQRGWTRFDPTPPSNAAPQGATDGPAALIREMLEAAAQSWNQNVVGFDMEKQVGVFRSVRRAFQDVSDAVPGVDGKSWSRKRMGAFALGVLLVGLAVYWYRRGRRHGPDALRKSPARLQRSMELCRRLDVALALRGVPRPEGTPIRSHAEALCNAGHPTGPEALELADIYLGVRFGGRLLGATEERQFIKRVNELRRGEGPSAQRKAA